MHQLILTYVSLDCFRSVIHEDLICAWYEMKELLMPLINLHDNEDIFLINGSPFF